jgi:hypothetical protein
MDGEVMAEAVASSQISARVSIWRQRSGAKTGRRTSGGVSMGASSDGGRGGREDDGENSRNMS